MKKRYNSAKAVVALGCVTTNWDCVLILCNPLLFRSSKAIVTRRATHKTKGKRSLRVCFGCRINSKKGPSNFSSRTRKTLGSNGLWKCNRREPSLSRHREFWSSNSNDLNSSGLVLEKDEVECRISCRGRHIAQFTYEGTAGRRLHGINQGKRRCP